jgi:hypothetical protein
MADRIGLSRCRDASRKVLLGSALVHGSVLSRTCVLFPAAPMILGGLVVEPSPMVIDFKGSHFEREIVLWSVRWYVAYPISYRQLEEMMEERGEEVDHTTLNRWVLKYVAQHSP